MDNYYTISEADIAWAKFMVQLKRYQKVCKERYNDYEERRLQSSMVQYMEAFDDKPSQEEAGRLILAKITEGMEDGTRQNLGIAVDHFAEKFEFDPKTQLEFLEKSVQKKWSVFFRTATFKRMVGLDYTEEKNNQRIQNVLKKMFDRLENGKFRDRKAYLKLASRYYPLMVAYAAETPYCPRQIIPQYAKNLFRISTEFGISQKRAGVKERNMIPVYPLMQLMTKTATQYNKHLAMQSLFEQVPVAEKKKEVDTAALTEVLRVYQEHVQSYRNNLNIDSELQINMMKMMDHIGKSFDFKEKDAKKINAEFKHVSMDVRQNMVNNLVEQLSRSVREAKPVQSSMKRCKLPVHAVKTHLYKEALSKR